MAVKRFSEHRRRHWGFFNALVPNYFAVGIFNMLKPLVNSELWEG
jgi:hypothetical protein